MSGVPSRSRLLPALLCAAFGIGLFHFFGNAARGYIDTRSLFVWWGKQWFDPASETQHGPLVVLAAVWLFARNLRAQPEQENADVRCGPAWFALIGAVGLHVLGYAMQQTRLSAVALLLFSWGVLRLAGGRRWGRAALFPLAFVVLAIPVSFLQPVGFYLRLWVSESAGAILRRLHFGVLRNGTQLFAIDGRFQYDVAAACSGVRSLVALFALSLILGYIRLRPAWARGLLTLLTLPFAFAGNFLRIFTIVLAGELAGQSAGERVHDGSGFVIFAVFLGLLLVTVSVLQKRSGNAEEQRSPPRAPSARPPPVEAGRGLPQSQESARPAFWRGAGVVVASTVAAAFAIQRLDARPPQPDAGVRLAANGIDPVALPEFIGTEWIGQQVDVTRAEREVLPPDTGYSRRNYVSMEDRSRQVFVSIVLSGRDRSSIHRPELCLVGQGWNITGRSDRVLRLATGESIPVTLLQIEREVAVGRKDRVRVSSWLAYWFVGRDTEVPSHAAMIWRSSWDRLLHFRADRWAYVVAQTPGNGSEADSLRDMEEVLSAIWPTTARSAVESQPK